jgi:hypothetical protein
MHQVVRLPKKIIFVAYIWLVGVPLLGLIGILNVGRHLHAPAAVGGDWNLEGDLQRTLSPACRSPLVQRQLTLTISQSGRYLILTLDQMQGAGQVENTTMSGAVSAVTNGISCASGEEVAHLNARIEPSVDGDLMTGVIEIRGCSGCVPFPFRATRRPASTKVGR